MPAPRAMILAAGFGTRLGALSDERPKPLLPVCDVPALRYSLALLEAAGLSEVIINLHHRGDLIERELGDRVGSLSITYSREETILGTGGGIRKAAPWLTRGGAERFLVLNGKLVVDLDLRRLLDEDAASARAGAAATMVIRAVPDPDRWGAVETEEGEVVRIIGKGRPAPAATQQHSAALHKWMFTGVHVLGPSLVERLPEGESCIIRQGYIPALAAGVRVAFHEATGYFEEHSTPRRYLDGNLALLARPDLLSHPPAPLVGVDESATIHPSAELLAPLRIGPGASVGAGATVGPFAVIGARSSVAAGSVVSRAVVWPDAHVEGSVREAIVTPRGVFPVEQ